MKATWLRRTQDSVAQRLLLAPLVPAAALYGAAAYLHRSCYTRGVCRKQRLACKVLSVGNLTVGGSGKTPAVAWIASALQRRGLRVAIASRGYGRSGNEPVVVVSDGERICAPLSKAGDEPMLLARRAPGVPVLVGSNRAVVGRYALEHFECQLLLLDDGFQHHRLGRDLDLLTFDGRSGLGNRRILPRGPLREPLSALALADGFLILDGPLPPDDDALLRSLAPQARIFPASRVLRGPIPLASAKPLSLPALKGADVGILAGLANPAAFRSSVEQLGARIIAERLFPDHHPYCASDLRGLSGEAPLWLTTEKDAVKLDPAWDPEALLHILELDLSLPDPDGFISWIEEKLMNG